MFNFNFKTISTVKQAEMAIVDGRYKSSLLIK